MTWMDVLNGVGRILVLVGLTAFMTRVPASRLAMWKVFCIVSVCFLFSLWLPQLYGPHAFLARPWITLGVAPALSVLVGAVCTGVIHWLRRRMAAESPE
ncbi:hypothetical protein V7R83_09195 [Lautropia mirabilis ATCC 51599]|jgi:hypothetical protein|uniref:Uncharacterized protein n=1 Tax=Lautropia mirabilis ATCC 51599 TaxID=887898 RepID=E7RXD1_9BURK|nr:hypothetical protein [Lautropia mirabilis]EFV94927.1 hypothetical protein HMPREF0551_1344 [Lautropia mirabilis ATCC 51599]VEH01461.1 Uncharacterised protein [Lautropia mirabilis]